MTSKKGGLGRGLDALFADAVPVYRDQDDAPKPSKKPSKSTAGTAGRKASDKSDAVDQLTYIDINDIKPNEDQPRISFDEDKLAELAASIKENGVITPLIVRKAKSGYELVAGERRWRASRLAGLREVPCIVKELDEKQNAIFAIIENMQREDLNPIEEAEGIKRMMNKFGFTQEQVSKAIGKSRPYIANSARLLGLPDDIKALISDGKMSAAHGRTLIGVSSEEGRRRLAERIVKEDLSVRATEKLVDKLKDDERPARKRRTKAKSAEIVAAEEELRRILGTKVNIIGEASTGKLEIEYYSLDELNRLIDLIRGLE